MSSSPVPESPAVVIVGGGVAAVEAVLALDALCGRRVDVTLIAPAESFAVPALDVGTPFARGVTPHLALDPFVREHGGRFRRTAVLRVDPVAQLVGCASGPDVPYDVLVLAPGARRLPAFPFGFVFGEDPVALSGILADLEQGWSRSVAFVVPAGVTWPLPAYELALMTAERLWDMSMESTPVHLVTAERAPLDVFGEAASREIAELLERAGVQLHVDAIPRVGAPGCVDTSRGERIEADRIVTLPILAGAQIDGVPVDADGFIPVDELGRVPGLPGVFVVGDAAAHPIKQGGLACQQADAVASRIALMAGADPGPPVPAPVLRGRLLTGRRDRFLRRELPAHDDGRVSEDPLWWPPAKTSGRYLAPYLDRNGLTAPLEHAPRHHGVEVVAPAEP